MSTKLKCIIQIILIRVGRVFVLSATVLAIIFVTVWFTMIRMPGKSYKGAMPPLTKEEESLRDDLRKDLEKLAGDIGDRNAVAQYENLCAAADFIEESFVKAGYSVSRQGYKVRGRDKKELMCYNLEVEIRGTTKADEIVIIGGHYDSINYSPGANDNGTGTVATLALARAFSDKESERTLRFVTFVNEEPPYFQSDDMGSLVYAKRCRERNEKIVAMLSLETIGYYSDEEGSQEFPVKALALAYPSKGNFIVFVGNTKSRSLVKEVIASFRRHAKFPSEAAAMPDLLPGVGWSDHWSFWQQGYPAIMATDTAPFRYEHYHTTEDTPDKVDYDRFAYVVTILEKVVADLVGLIEES